MEYTSVHNMKISRLSLGTVQLGLKYGIANSSGKPDYHKSSEILKIAVDYGINCFDTAPAYGDSERVIGSFLSTYRCSSGPAIIVTKLPAMNITGASEDQVYHTVKEHVLKSARCLQVDTIPVYLLHRASDITACGGFVIESLLKLKDEGLIGILGASVYTPEEVELVLKTQAMKAIQVPVNIFDHRLISTGLLSQLKQMSFIVFARSVFLQGLFFLDTDRLPPGLALAAKPLRRLHEFSREHEIGIAELSLKFVRDLPGITSIVVGAEEPGQVRNSINLSDSSPLPPTLREELMSTFADMPLQLVNPSLWSSR